MKAVKPDMHKKGLAGLVFLENVKRVVSKNNIV